LSDRRAAPEPDDDADLRRALGKAIAIRRVELGLKRNDLRDRAGLSYPYIAELENGSKQGSTRALAALAAALEMELSELMERAETLRTSSTPEQTLRSSESWFSGDRIASEREAPRYARRPMAFDSEPPPGRGGRRGWRVEVDPDQLADMVRQIVREELRAALREERAKRP
jgi:transcriptional regulator with XRE-family HTH domain